MKWPPQADESYSGATDELGDAGDDDGGDGEVDADELDFGRDVGFDAVVAEDGPPSDSDEDEKD